MTGQQFADAYLDPPSGIFFIARTPQRDNGSGWNTKAHYYRGFVADALRRARRNSGMGMADATATASIPAYLQRMLNKAATIRDTSGATIAPNVATDFAALTSLGVVPS
jgi:hypothetical protein